MGRGGGSGEHAVSEEALSRPMVGEDPAMRRILRMVGKVAPTDSSVLVLGESGTGKELIARVLHEQSPRRRKPLVPIHCGAIPAALLESEIFGRASQSRPGRLELADGGTIFLDEIGEMSLPLQVKLLRVLQERVFEPVGAVRTMPVDVRVIAASHKDLAREVAEGRFREDLYYRLNVVELHLPPLRDRRSDIPRLLEFFNARLAESRGRSVKGFAGDVITRLTNYRWPGNVCELENIVERLAVFCEGEIVELEDLPRKILDDRRAGDDLPVDLPDGGLDLRQLLSDIEDRLIRQALDRTGWNKNQAASLLRMNRTTLVEKLKKRDMLTPP